MCNASTAQGTNRAKENTTKSSQELRVTWTEYSFVESFIKLLTLSPCADQKSVKFVVFYAKKSSLNKTEQIYLWYIILTTVNLCLVQIYEIALHHSTILECRIR